MAGYTDLVTTTLKPDRLSDYRRIDRKLLLLAPGIHPLITVQNRSIQYLPGSRVCD